MGETTASSIFSHASNRVPGDTVFYSIYPDFSLTPRTPATTTSQLQSLHLQILKTLDPYTSAYIFHHQPFTLSLSSDPIPHLHGRLRFGHNLDDEWFVLSLLLLVVSSSFPRLSVAVSDSDGEFLLIESAFHLPRWLNPDTAANRLFLRQGHLHLIPTSAFPSTSPLSLRESLSYLITNGRDTLAGDSVQNAIRSRIRGYPEAAIRKNSHRVRIRVPLYVAQVLRHEPNFISLAVEGFYDRDVDSMKYGAKMERFLGNNKNMVRESAKMTRAMYAQLVQQRFQAPKCYPMPGREKGEEIYTEAELGMKVAVGFEMMYQVKKSEGEEGKGETWEAFRESLERSGYFQETIPGSKEYRRLMENAEEYYRNSSLFSRARFIFFSKLSFIS